MGQWYDIGLQAGKTVAEKVDEFKGTWTVWLARI